MFDNICIFIILRLLCRQQCKESLEKTNLAGRTKKCKQKLWRSCQNTPFFKIEVLSVKTGFKLVRQCFRGWRSARHWAADQRVAVIQPNYLTSGAIKIFKRFWKSINNPSAPKNNRIRNIYEVIVYIFKYGNIKYTFQVAKHICKNSFSAYTCYYKFFCYVMFYSIIKLDTPDTNTGYKLNIY